MFFGWLVGGGVLLQVMVLFLAGWVKKGGGGG